MSKRAAVDEMIEKMSVLPIVSQVLVRLNRAAEDDRTGADDLSRVILRDQALTLRMLKVVNSSYYHKQGRERVTEISKAVVILGFNNVRRLALGLSVYDVLQKDQHLPAVQLIWNHALLTAITARQLAERTGYEPVEEAFVAGLVHDMGKLILLRCDPDTYGGLLAETAAAKKEAEAAQEQARSQGKKARSPRPISLRQRERKVFGLSHVQAGRKLARRWGLPPELVETVGEHHVGKRQSLGKNAPPILRLAVAANHFTHLLEADPRGNLFTQALVTSKKLFGIDAQQLDGMHRDIVTEFTDTVGAFGLEDKLGLAAVSETAAPGTRPEIDTEVMLHSLQDITSALVEDRPTEQMIDLILDRLVASLAVDRVLLFTVKDSGRCLAWTAGRGGISDDLASLPAIPIQEETGFLGRCVLERKAGHVTSCEDPLLSQADQRLLELMSVRECAVVPLLLGDRPVGLLWVDNHRCDKDLSAELRTAVATFANSLALAMARETPVGAPA